MNPNKETLYGLLESLQREGASGIEKLRGRIEKAGENDFAPLYRELVTRMKGAGADYQKKSPGYRGK